MNKNNSTSQTKEKIIAAAVQLFMEKGFEKTSMQDIANALGISKGGIYHHFKSKEEIIHLVRENKASHVKENLNKWLDTINAGSAKDKLVAILEKNVTDQEAHAFDSVFSTQMKSADFVLEIMKNSINDSSPVIADLMKDGLKDGSITTKYPEEAAEVFLLLINVWCDPVIFKTDEEKLARRLKFVQHMMRNIGADIVTDKIIHETSNFLKHLYDGDRVNNE